MCLLLLTTSSSKYSSLLLFLLSIPCLLAVPPCSCNPESVWLDVMILFDSSTATTDRGLQELFGYVQYCFSWVNVQNSSCSQQFHTRIGMIVYAQSVQLLYPLGSLDEDQLENIWEIPFLGESATNIEGAIKTATSEFAGAAHRPNARRVIFLLGTAYFSGGYNAPKQVADTFKESNGIIVVYNYQQSNGVATPTLAELASPGYFLSNYLDPTGSLARKALCDANCFCPPNMIPFGLDPVSNVPTTAANYGNSLRTCIAEDKILAAADNQDKNAFLSSALNNNFWTGLRYNASLADYTWPDGSVLVGNYQPWASSNRTAGLDCVFTYTGDLSWRLIDCRNGLQYACEDAACDSKHYCTEPF